MPCHAATVIEKANNADLDAPAVKTIFDVSFQIQIRRLQTLNKNQAKLIPNNYMYMWCFFLFFLTDLCTSLRFIYIYIYIGTFLLFRMF